MPSILFVECDPYLAGIYGRKFELDGWEVMIEESLVSAERIAAKERPNILIIDDQCLNSPIELIKRLRSLPTLQKTKIVLLGTIGDHERIDQALKAGAADYLLVGHFVPQEAVAKMRRLLV